MGSQDLWWTDLVAGQPDVFATEHTGADEPLMIIYTSGTTGLPKGAVHSHCGFPIKTAQDMMHCFDVHDGETMYWVSDMGWMMGPWEVLGMTLLGGTVVLYDGALDFPAPDRLWALVERHRVNILGVSPTLIRALMRHGEDPVRAHDLGSLRILGSTGEPWNPEPWRWFFDVVGRGRLPIINYSGGTEVSGGLVSRQRPHAAQAGGLCRPAAWDRGRRRRRAGAAGPQSGRRAGRSGAVDWDDARVLERSRALSCRPTGRASLTCGCTATGPRSTKTDSGTSSGAPTTRSKSRANGLGPAEVESVLVEDPAVLEAAADRRAGRDERTGAGLLLRAATRSRARRRDDRTPDGARRSIALASRSSRRRSSSCAICRRRATRRSCAASSAPRISGMNQAIFHRSRTRRRSRRSASLGARSLQEHLQTVMSEKGFRPRPDGTSRRPPPLAPEWPHIYAERAALRLRGSRNAPHSPGAAGSICSSTRSCLPRKR